MLPMASAFAYRPNYIYDNAGVVDATWKAKINDFGHSVDNATTAEIVIVTLKSLNGTTVDQAKVDYFNSVPLDGVKGIGKAEKNNGVLILIVMDTHDWAFETGYGVEGNLTDAECGRIGRDVMTPLFQQGKFGEGLYDGMVAVAAKLGYKTVTVSTTTDSTDNSGTTLITTGTDTSTTNDIPWFWIAIHVIAVIIVLVIITSGDSDGDSGSSWSGGSSSGGHSGGGGGFGGGHSGGGGAIGKW